VTFSLRPYQNDCVQAIRDDLDQSPSTVAVLATGLGKTVIAAELIKTWEKGNCLFLAHTRELVEQSANKIGQFLGYEPIIEMGDIGGDSSEFWHGGMVVCASVQSMRNDRRLNKYAEHPFGLVIVDESHHATSSSYRKVIDYFIARDRNCKVVGVTATPKRADNAALGIVFQSVAFQMGIRPAIDQGWLCPIRQEVVTVESLSFDGLSTRRNELGESDFSTSELEALLMEEKNLHEMATASIEKVDNRRTLVFTAGVKQAERLAEILNRYRPDCAAFVSGATDRDARTRIITDYKEGRLQFLCSCQVLIEGFDAPETSALVMGRPTKSISAYTQMLGRGLRPWPGVVDGYDCPEDRKLAMVRSDKSECLVLDFAGVSEHTLVDSVDVLGGDYDIEVLDLAKATATTQPKTSDEIEAALEAAKNAISLKRILARMKVKADGVKYSTYESSPFLYNQRRSSHEMNSVPRGSVSDAQLSLLVGLGIRHDTALQYSKAQAGAIIDQRGKTHCTERQARTLMKFGIQADGIGVKRAGRIIDALAANGWRRPSTLPE
jgi:superfamily II DNA or RNA helicase